MGGAPSHLRLLFCKIVYRVNIEVHVKSGDGFDFVSAVFGVKLVNKHSVMKLKY